MSKIDFFQIDHMGVRDFFDLVDDLTEYAQRQHPYKG